MKLFVVALVAGVASAGRMADRDELDFSSSSVMQTLRNTFRLPAFFGGSRDVDSDVRFGWSNTQEDKLGESFGSRMRTRDEDSCE